MIPLVPALGQQLQDSTCQHQREHTGKLLKTAAIKKDPVHGVERYTLHPMDLKPYNEPHRSMMIGP